MSRTNDQNAILHCWCREISAHLREAKIPNVSEATVKELCLLTLGNTVNLLGHLIAMRSNKYKMIDTQLTEHDHKHGFISMSELLARIQVWAATDLNLILESPNEEKVIGK